MFAMTRRCAQECLTAAVCAGAAAYAVQWLVPGGWWLNSRLGVASTGVAVALVALAMTLLSSSTTEAQWCSLGGVWAGANVALTLRLFAIEPGTIFPIVMVVGASILAPPLSAGPAAS